MSESKSDLRGTVCLVAGATRGAGRAIAVALGERGATVYCTGRSSRAHPGERPEVIEDSAELVSRAGGVGVAVRADHTREEQVEALCRRIQEEQGGLDVLVNDLWGGEKLIEFGVPFWACSIEKGRRMIEQAVVAHAITSRHAVPLMLERPRGLIVEVTDGDHFGWRGAFFYDLVKMAAIRMAFSMAWELRDRPLTALAVTPGFLRSEEMLEHFGVTEATWREAVAQEPHFIASESPAYVARAIAALAADPQVKERAGRVFSSWDLARHYRITDADGSQPDWGAYFEQAFGQPYPAVRAQDYASWLRSPLEIVLASGQGSSSLSR
ncbi:MAG: SDR family oxidoreductase [Polyangiaceae bacterium]|jgi:NAD(P)-dependent dehydrogenase (short-subunit alcohol dehydrogenase family)|nr:SDR family oxidoreductase [Polyangiaceae bacterium]